MGLKFAKAGSHSASPQETPAEAETKSQANTSTNQSSSSPKKSFLLKGGAAKQAIVKEEARIEAAKDAAGKMFEFWMKEHSPTRTITFLDGELDNEGMLDINMVHRHTVMQGGRPHNYVCTQESEGYCALCAKGETKPNLVGLLTVIDHTPYKIQSGANAGKTVVNQRRLYVATRDTIAYLTKQAGKKSGLTGCTYEVDRTGDKKPRVGDSYEFVSKKSLSAIKSEYDMKDEELVPANYEEELGYLSVQQQVELGLGPAPSGPGYEKPKSSIDKNKLADQL